MTERRQARGLAAGGVVTGPEGVPQALLVGRLIEVWSDDSKNALSAFARFAVARRHWLNEHGITSTAQACELVPMGNLWSYDFIVDDPERLKVANARLRAAGVTRRNTPRLRREAVALLDRVPSKR